MNQCRLCQKGFRVGNKIVEVTTTTVEGFDNGVPELKSTLSDDAVFYHEKCYDMMRK